MSDVFVPGLRSRFNSDRLVDDLMRVERIPRDRSERNVEGLQSQRTYWQELGQRITALRDSARFLYSFQNPFSDRIANSSDPSVLTATTTREAEEQEHSFTVRQIARADRFLSQPLDNNFRVDEGTYTFSVGQNTVSFQFRGGSLREFTDVLNRRGRDVISANLVAVEAGRRSLLIESRLTGEENRLVFSDDAETLGINIGIIGEIKGYSPVSIKGDVLKVAAGDTAFISFNADTQASRNLVLQFEVATEVTGGNAPPASPPSPPQIAVADSTDESDESNGIDGLEDSEDSSEISSAVTPAWTPLEPETVARQDNMQVVFLNFADGTSRALPPVRDSEDFLPYQFRLFDIAGDRTIASIEIVNQNSHRNVAIQNIRVVNPDVIAGSMGALRPVSEAQDAIIDMEGIEIRRSSNAIADLVPGLTLNARAPSDRPVRLSVEPDREGIKDGIIAMVANYNRLMAEINVLTRNDDRVIQELSYLSREDQDALRSRLGVFAGDSILNQFRNSMQRAISSPHLVSREHEFGLLAQIGIGTDARRSGGAALDPSRLRGYLEIDERVLDTAIENNLTTVQRIFGFDTTGDFVVNSGVAFTLETLGRPFTEVGGIIALKTGTIDSRISQETRRMDTLDRQLASREAALRIQFSQMEESFSRMERMSNSLDQFSQQNSNRR